METLVALVAVILAFASGWCFGYVYGVERLWKKAQPEITDSVPEEPAPTDTVPEETPR